MVSEKKSILVVDDEPDTLELMQTILRHEGYDVLKALNGSEALEEVKQKPDLILLDIRMPGELNGIEVCKRLKTDPIHKSIPIIIFSAKVLDHHIEEGFQAGAEEYVTKPFSSAELLRIIGKYLHKN
ncbi:two-component system response regulator [Candidatus Heimdallarchaeota archaeon B3_Heim]|nr:MAG: two-component system response regulator [Candidatus Heimdallarchaeota archaeon B3_Heim]